MSNCGERHSVEFHLLCGFVVAWTGHVGQVGCYGLDLPHELIPNPGIVLQQRHSAVKHCAIDSSRQQCFIFLHILIFSQISFRKWLSPFFRQLQECFSQPNQTAMKPRALFFFNILLLATQLLKTECKWRLLWQLLPATAINDPSGWSLFLCFSIYNISDAAKSIWTFQLKTQLGWIMVINFCKSLLISFSFCPILKNCINNA